MTNYFLFTSPLSRVKLNSDAMFEGIRVKAVVIYLKRKKSFAIPYTTIRMYSSKLELGKWGISLSYVTYYGITYNKMTYQTQ